MTPLEEIYVRLFLIVPLLFYIGYSIMNEKKHVGTIMFHGIVVLTILLAVFFHLKYIYKIMRRIFRNETYQREFGFFVLSLAIYLVVLCIHDLWLQRKLR
jgi:hypothetical protein